MILRSPLAFQASTQRQPITLQILRVRSNSINRPNSTPSFCNPLRNRWIVNPDDGFDPSKLPISNVRYTGNLLSGQVSNDTGKPITAVRVNYEVLDRNGNVIDSGYIEAQPFVIPPGGSATFQGYVSGGARVQTTFVESSDRTL